MQYTKMQQRVIELENKNILVSAAAGSGKTAVLVERIIQKVCSKQSPIDIDRLLIVTFTNAAAAQMRERISTAIQKKLEETPENEHLQRQTVLIHNAQITTIHSFCLYILRNHFHKIDLDPGFRIGDEGELKLLKNDVLKKLLEEKFSEGNADFLNFVECFATKKRDTSLEEDILKLYEFAISYPWPKQWLTFCKEEYLVEDIEQLREKKWIKQLQKEIVNTIKGLEERLYMAVDICHEAGGPYMYEEALRADASILKTVQDCTEYDEYYSVFQNISHTALSRKRDEAVSEGKKEIVKILRSEIKKGLEKIGKQYCYALPEQILSDMQGSKRNVEVLSDITSEFYQRYLQDKKEKNVLDFGDLEHFALQILLTESEGNLVPSAVAEEYKSFFHEIMIDEYQDSNLVQEYLLGSIAKDTETEHNLFMVGDVKQSIYKFRLARPELFMEKYNTYEIQGESPNQRVDLHQNFRSRNNVLNTVNTIFEQIMTKELGNISYDDKAALNYGAAYTEDTDAHTTELMLLEINKEGEVDEDLSGKELEAKAIARRIKELVGNFMLYDRENGTERAADYSDIVILLQTTTGWDDVFQNILMADGIPTHISSKTGYFATLEVSTLLNYLKILDNPVQDIPLAAVLKSSFGEFTDEELALVRSQYKRVSFYEAILTYGDNGSSESVKHKCIQFVQQLKSYRGILPYTPVHELLHIIVRDTDYENYIMAMPAGRQRKANLQMLLEKAGDFEKTSFKGLFHFIRYIEQLQKYAVDFGEAGILGEHENAVRIISIHKSKGLEFPICIVAGLGKRFNMQDASRSIAIDMDYGIGVDFVDTQLRVKEFTLLKKAIQQKIRNENLAEELRVLYVALTRAEEKLILCGTVNQVEKMLKEKQVILRNTAKELAYSYVSGAKCFMDFIVGSFIRHEKMIPILNSYDIYTDCQGEKMQLKSALSVVVLRPEDLVDNEIENQVLKEAGKQNLLAEFENFVADKNTQKELEERFLFQYPYTLSEKMYTKITVSDIKKQAMQEQDEFAVPIYEEPVLPLYFPAFAKADEETKLTGAFRGTAYHKILELLDLQKVSDKKEIISYITQMEEEGKVTEETVAAVNIEALARFLKSNLAMRMAEAEKNGMLFKEQPFVLGVSADTLNPDFPKEETVLVQGIIDVYFEEDGELVVADYKTDRVSEKQELVDRYRIQLDYYASALERLTGKHVKEKIIYAFGLDCEFSL